MPASRKRASALPPALSPELATLVDRLPPGDWLFEVKLDGYRMLVRVEGKEVRLITRNANDWTDRFPTLLRALQRTRLPDGWYDGEIVVLDERGHPSFNLLQNAVEGAGNEHIVLYLFDAPYLDGRDIRQLPVEERRALLEQAFDPSDLVRFSAELPEKGEALLASACKLGLEGIIGKRRGSPYVHRRSADWIKLKCAHRQEFVIGAYTWPDNTRVGIGALLVGYHGDDGRLHYAGKVGTGFTGEMLTKLRRQLDGMVIDKRPFVEPTGHDRRATWVEPRLVCEVEYREWPAAGQLRHASFKGLRKDKPAKQARSEVLRVTHGERVIDASTGFTKLDLVRYYAEVAPWALPHLRGRHIFIRRAPVGVQGETLFQEHPQGLPGLRGTDPKLWPGHEPAISIETADDLATAGQAGMVELHTWNSTAAAIKLADRVVFDIDPGEGVPWGQVQEAALLTRTLLEELGLQSWLKTSGGKGLHVVVPLVPEFGHADAKSFARKVVEHLARTIPQRFVAKSGPRNRVGKVFVDFLRNGQSQTTVAAFSARARPGMGVSMTVAWDELQKVAAGDHWNIDTALKRLRALRKDPWAGYWGCRQSLREAFDGLKAS